MYYKNNQDNILNVCDSHRICNTKFLLPCRKLNYQFVLHDGVYYPNNYKIVNSGCTIMVNDNISNEKFVTQIIYLCVRH